MCVCGVCVCVCDTYLGSFPWQTGSPNTTCERELQLLTTLSILYLKVCVNVAPHLLKVLSIRPCHPSPIHDTGTGRMDCNLALELNVRESHTTHTHTQTCMHTHASLAHTHILTHTLTYSLTLASLTHSLTHTLTMLTHSLSLSHTHTHTHTHSHRSLTYTHTHSFTHSLTHTLTHRPPTLQ